MGTESVRKRTASVIATIDAAIANLQAIKIDLLAAEKAFNDALEADSAKEVFDTPFLTPTQVSNRIGIPSGTLAVWRSEDRGPRSVRIGKYVRYPVQDLLEWEATLTKEWKE